MYLLKKADIINFAKVKTHTRKGKKGTFVVREFDRKDRQKKVVKIISGVVGAAAISTVIGIGGYQALKNKTKKMIPKSADWVKNNFNKYADDVIVRDKYLNRKSAIVALPGLIKQEDDTLIKRLKQDIKFKGEVFYNPLKTALDKIPYTDNLNLSIYRRYKYLITNQVKNGYNPTAREAAARAYAFHKKYPDKNIVLLGNSWGGATGNEAAEILKHIDDFDNNKLKLLTISSNHYNLLDKTNVDRLDIVDKFDTLHTNKPFKNSFTGSKGDPANPKKNFSLHFYMKNYKKEIKTKLDEWSK